MTDVQTAVYQIDASGMHYRDLNAKLREVVNGQGISHVEIDNVYGQRYLGTDLHRPKGASFRSRSTSTERPATTWPRLWMGRGSSCMATPRTGAATR